MPTPRLTSSADPTIVAAWVAGWALSRGTPAPIAFDGGLRVDVGLPLQRARYVLPRFEPAPLHRLAVSLSLPWTFLKVCAQPDSVAAILPDDWTVQAPVFMMTTSMTRQRGMIEPPGGYGAHVWQEGAMIVAELRDEGGEIAARGRMALTATHGVFDQIVTDERHRRRGLGSIVMNILGQEAVARGIEAAVLVATEDGRALYTALGWALHSPVASCVMPGEPAP